jgi:hypothetical protein
MLGGDFGDALEDGYLHTIIIVDLFVSLHGTGVENRAIVTTSLIPIVQIVLVGILESIG